jgi:aspartyl-tRNA(Asn)/glutamyl-tRNA(Gln) amidotransferase subunit A
MADPETAFEIADAIRTGAMSAEEAVRRSLDRLEASQPVTNAFSQVWLDEALAAAREADSVAPDDRPPFHGVPVAIKDLFGVRGHEATGCSRAYEGAPPASVDGAAVRALRDAGMIPIGKTNQHELACGATNLVSACGPTRNPHDPQRMTGGSSGGSAAAVVTGVVPLALGSDTGGSIRMPSSLCGAWGLKTTWGRYSMDGAMPLAPSLDTVGPIGATAADLAAWLRANGSHPQEGPLTTVAILDGWFRRSALPEVRSATDALAARLAEATGADLIHLEADGIEDTREVWTDLAWSEFATAHPWLVDRPELLLPQTAASIEHGASVPPDRRAELRRRVDDYRGWFAEKLERADVLITPTTPFAAPRIDESDAVVTLEDGTELDWRRRGPLAWYTEPVNLAGLPALSVPATKTATGLPIGVQIIGPPDSEERLVALAMQLASENH